MKKVLAVASAGGHWTQLMRLTPAFDGCEVHYVTTDKSLKPVRAGDVHVVTDANRWERLRMLRMFFEVARIMIFRRPDAVVTTGAAPGLAAVIIGRTLGCRTVWIDSIANSEEMSGSGRLAKRFASLWLTQWEHVAGSEGAQYWGAVL